MLVINAESLCVSTISVSNAIVPLESGKLIVLSFVGLTAWTFVSLLFDESPSKAILVILLIF